MSIALFAIGYARHPTFFLIRCIWDKINYPHMPIGMLRICRLLFVSLFVCLQIVVVDISGVG